MNKKGFTLIELLVVISIIGVLSTVAMTSLRSARFKAKDSAIISAANSIMKAAQIDAVSSQSYSAYYFFQWGATNNACNTSFASASSPASVRGACNTIVNNMGTTATTTRMYFYSGYSATYPTRPRFSIMVYLPGANKYYCIGSHGSSSVATNGACGGASWTCAGCVYDTTAGGG